MKVYGFFDHMFNVVAITLLVACFIVHAPTGAKVAWSLIIVLHNVHCIHQYYAVKKALKAQIDRLLLEPWQFPIK